jgi:hypothetical protein
MGAAMLHRYRVMQSAEHGLCNDLVTNLPTPKPKDFGTRGARGPNDLCGSQ